MTPDERRIGIVLKGYPRLSETFIAQEIRELERQGFRLSLISLRHPTDRSTHPVHAEISASVHYLPEYLHLEPRRVVGAWWRARRQPGYGRAVRAFVKDLGRDFTRNRIRRFGQGMVIAAEQRGEIGFLYSHFIHTPSSAARYAAIIMSRPFAISAHAKDIWTTPAWELREKLAECEWCVTCTKAGLAELRRHVDDPDKVHLVYHGIDLERFPPAPGREACNGTDPDRPLRLLSVGRAVAKKGLDTVIDALAALPEDLHWRWTHIGGGELRDDLRAQAERLGIAERCEFRGAMAQADVLEAYRAADLFVLPCRIDPTGDRDGLPNVVVEAQSQSLAVVTTAVTGAPELIEDGVNGVFVKPDDPAGLAAEIASLAGDPALRESLGSAGNDRVRRDFDHHATIGELAALLREGAGISSKEAAQ